MMSLPRWSTPNWFGLISLFGVFLLSACAAATTENPISAGKPSQAPAAVGEVEPTQPAPTAAPAQQAAILEARRIFLAWPPRIRVGESDWVRLVLDMDEEGRLTPTVLSPGQEQSSQAVNIQNVYDTHDVTVEARLDLAGVEYQPADALRLSLHPGQTLTFQWSVSPPEAGTYRGTVSMFVHYIPKDGSQEIVDQITNQPVEIRGVNLFGLSGAAARVIGGVGVLFGSVLSLDNLIPWFWRRFRKSSRAE